VEKCRKFLSDGIAAKSEFTPIGCRLCFTLLIILTTYMKIVEKKLRTLFMSPQPFKLQFAVGEFDMVIHDPSALTCQIYEVKHSKEVVPNQYRHLVDPEKGAQTQHRFGTITGRYVIYRGEATASEGVQYLNVEKYLNSLA
jgi:hypothetical protein